MQNYLDLLQQVLTNGILQDNRTNIPTLTIPGASLQFTLTDPKTGLSTFPAVTTKQLAFSQVKGELLGFLNGATSAADFRSLGCTIWDQNANENQVWLDNPHRYGEDDLGPIYGAQWRNFNGNNSTNNNPKSSDQLQQALHSLRNNPTSRRIIVSAWNPLQLDQMALPPCHLLFQLLPHISTNKLHMCMYQRSCDLFLGVPFNISSYALLLHLLSAWSGFKPGTLTMFLADVHIYQNHLTQVQEQLTREPLPLPQLSLTLPPNIRTMPLQEILNLLQPDDIQLLNYKSKAPIKAPMAV